MSHFFVVSLKFVSSIFVSERASSSNTFHMLLLESQFLERKTDEMKVSRVVESLKNKNLIDIDKIKDQQVRSRIYVAMRPPLLFLESLLFFGDMIEI